MDRRVDDTSNTSLAHIIDDIGSPVFNTTAGHGRSVGVDRDNGIGLHASHRFQCSFQPCHFLFFAHFLGTGTRRESTNINHRSAFTDNLIGPFCNLMFGLFAAACIETVGRTVEDSHDFRAAEVYQSASYIDGIIYRFHTLQSYYILLDNAN